MADRPAAGRDAGWHRHEAIAALSRLRAAWPWLAELREPGPTSPTRRYVSARQAATESYLHRRDRAARHVALSGGSQPDVRWNIAHRGTPTVPMGPHGDAVRLGPVAARAEIAATTVALLRDVWAYVQGEDWDVTIYDPTQRAFASLCGWCRDGILEPPSAWPGEWPADPITCPRCNGRGTVPTGAVCLTCRTAGPCDCDATDAVTLAAFAALATVLPKLDEDEDGEHFSIVAHRVLRRSDEHVRRVARVLDEARRITARCPACGQLELWADVTSTDERDWSIACRNPLCECRGPGCGCGRPVRYQGRRHRWPQKEWHDPGGFADRLGVRLPGQHTRET